MKTIKIFLASSDELADERDAFGNLIRRLNDIYIRQGIHVQLLRWEDMDPCYNNCRKQDEYNAWIRESQIFVALFRTKAGQYTLEELDVASEENRKREEPKLMIYCQTLQPGELETKELTEFKQRLDKELGHFWGNYPTADKLHFDFVMFFLRSEVGQGDALKVENGQVVLGNLLVASMDNLPFAAGNKDYQRMKAELDELNKEITSAQEKLAKKQERLEKRKARMEKEPDDEDYREEYEEVKEEVDDMVSRLQVKLNKRNALKEEFAGHQKALFDTAKRVSEMQLEKVSSELRRAVEEFEQGHIEAANAILDGLEREADHHMEQLELDKKVVHQDIEALMLQAKTVMADAVVPINERKQRVLDIYVKADDWAEKSALDKEKYEELLDDYAYFLRNNYNDFYDQTLSVNLRLLSIRETLYGTEDRLTVTSYDEIGDIYYHQGDYDKALEFYNKELAFGEKEWWTNTMVMPITRFYNKIGNVYYTKGDYDKALEFHTKALASCRSNGWLIEGETNNNVGNDYYNQGDYDKALEHYTKALAVYEAVDEEYDGWFGTGLNEYKFLSYNGIGNVYYEKGDYDKALEFCNKALGVCEKRDEYDKALELCNKILDIRGEAPGTENLATAVLYDRAGYACYKDGDNDKALEYYTKALASREKMLGTEHPDIADSYNKIGDIYYHQGDYGKAQENYTKALVSREKVLGTEHPDTAESYGNIGSVYYVHGDNDKVLEYYNKALDSYKASGTNPGIVVSYMRIGMLYAGRLNDYDRALEFYNKALNLEYLQHNNSVRKLIEKLSERAKAALKSQSPA